MKILYLTHNHLQSLPESLSRNVYLTNLCVAKNSLRFLPDLRALTHLLELTCDGNKLTRLPDLVAKPRLRMLNFADNLLTTLPENLHSCNELVLLYTNNNRLRQYPEYWRLQKLEMVTFDVIGLMGPDLTSNMPLLTQINRTSKRVRGHSEDRMPEYLGDNLAMRLSEDGW